MTVVWIVIILAVILVAALGIEIYREVHTFHVTRYTLSPARLSGMTRDINIVFLSDLHNKVYGSRNAALFRAVRREKPDLILIGGDMLIGKPDVPYDAALEFTGSLTELCPVIYACGNHEQRMKEEPEKYTYSYQEYKGALEKKGVIFLENKSLSVEAGKAKLNISGLELPMESYRKFRKEKIRGADVERCLGFCADDRKEDAYQILLAHNPSYMSAYKEWGADLVLSGHLHGGIVRIPGIGGIITPQAFLFPKYSGEMRVEGDQAVIVSKGLGTHTINIRLFNLPEVVSLQLKKPL